MGGSWPKNKSIADIVLLEDGSSAVPGFEEAATMFINDMRTAGVTVCKSADFTPGPNCSRNAIGKISPMLTMGAAGIFNSWPAISKDETGVALFIIDPQNDFH